MSAVPEISADHLFDAARKRLRDWNMGAPHTATSLPPVNLSCRRCHRAVEGANVRYIGADRRDDGTVVLDGVSLCRDCGDMHRLTLCAHVVRLNQIPAAAVNAEGSGEPAEPNSITPERAHSPVARRRWQAPLSLAAIAVTIGSAAFVVFLLLSRSFGASL